MAAHVGKTRGSSCHRQPLRPRLPSASTRVSDGPTGRRSFSIRALAQLRAEHAFWIFGFPFMVLHYRMHRKS